LDFEKCPKGSKKFQKCKKNCTLGTNSRNQFRTLRKTKKCEILDVLKELKENISTDRNMPETIPTWKKYRHASEEQYCKHKRNKTLANWKRNYNIDVPTELFDNFKKHKKLYMQLRELKDELDVSLLNLMLTDEIDPC